MLLIGVGLGVLGHGMFAVSDAAWMLFLGQALVATLVSVILGLGVTVAQNLYPSSAGFASSAFFGSLGLSVTAGSLIGSLRMARLRVPTVFLAPAAICATALVGLALLGVQEEASPQPEDSRSPETETP